MQYNPTHYYPRDHYVSRLDRIYISTPGWIIIQLNAIANTYDDPYVCYQNGVSDHVPVLAKLSSNASVKKRLVIQPHVARHPLFRHYAVAFVKAVDLRHLPPYAQLLLHTQILQHAGRLVVNEMHLQDPHNDHTIRLSLNHQYTSPTAAARLGVRVLRFEAN